MASTVLAIAVVGICGPLGAASEQSRAARERNTALTLARQLMEEIAAKPLCDEGTTCHAGPESGETTRAKYDSADDYYDYKDSSTGLKSLDGSSIQVGSGGKYSRKVKFEYRTSPSGASTSSGDFGLVTVVVETPGKQEIKISRLLTRQSAGF